MNNKAIIYYFEKSIERGGGYHLSREQEKICKRALRAFRYWGCRGLFDCYKQPSNAKQSEYLQCEYLCVDSDVHQVCSTIVGYNCQTFSWAAIWCDKYPDFEGYVTIYLRYDTYKHCRLIEVCDVPYEWVK